MSFIKNYKNLGFLYFEIDLSDFIIKLYSSIYSKELFNLLDVVINNNSFKNEPVNLGKMLNSNNRKGIFNHMTNYVKESLTSLSFLKSRFYLEAFEGTKLNENEFYAMKVSNLYAYIDFIINNLCISLDKPQSMDHSNLINKLVEQNQSNTIPNFTGKFLFLKNR